MIPDLRLKDLREDRFWNQKTVSSLLSINRRTYAEYELQNNMLPIKYLPKLSNIYNVLSPMPTIFSVFLIFFVIEQAYVSVVYMALWALLCDIACSRVYAYGSATLFKATLKTDDLWCNWARYYHNKTIQHAAVWFVVVLFICFMVFWAIPQQVIVLNGGTPTAFW